MMLHCCIKQVLTKFNFDNIIYSLKVVIANITVILAHCKMLKKKSSVNYFHKIESWAVC